jgi:hypothetical protein
VELCVKLRRVEGNARKLIGERVGAKSEGARVCRRVKCGWVWIKCDWV